jgi:SPASM domain peptide maturase of grasp-with-spasm system
MKVLAANCKIVKGQQRACLVDYQHAEMRLIPLLLADYLEGKTSYNQLDEMSRELLKELESLDMVLEIEENEIAFFPAISLDFHIPHRVHNAIIDYKSSKYYQLSTAVKALETIKCPHIEIRFYDAVNIDFLEEISHSLLTSSIESIDLYLPYHHELNYNSLERLKVNNGRFRWIFVHSYPSNLVPNKAYSFIKHTTQIITDQSHCGVIHYFYFELHLDVFTESKHHNTCLNRKISIDAEGYIKNCPSMAHAFGHISDTSLEDVLDNPEFTKLWNIKKDDIQKCQQCEFRHICTDCRAYREDPSALYSAPLKCGYDPQTCEWEAWSTNPLKQQAIHHYQLISYS